MRLWKVLDENQRSCHGGRQQWVIGEWIEIDGPLLLCADPADGEGSALHFCRDEDLVRWLGPAIHPAEIDGEYAAEDGHNSKVGALRGRITSDAAKAAAAWAADSDSRAAQTSNLLRYLEIDR